MGFLLSKRKRKVIRSSSIHICWLLLCKILSYVRVFTIQKREEFSFFNFLFSIDCKHKQMCIFFSSADKLSSSWSFIIRHCADPGWSQKLLNLAATRQAEHFAFLKGWIQMAVLTQFMPRLADVKRLEDLPFNSEWLFVAKLCGMWWFNNHTCELSVELQKSDTWCYIVPHLCWTTCFCLEEIAPAVQRYRGALHVFFKGPRVSG